jgi:hypothetical protein
MPNTSINNARNRSVAVHCIVDGTNYKLYTCPANCKTHVSLLFITNAGTAASDVTVDWLMKARNLPTATSDTPVIDELVHIIGGKNLGVGEFIKFDGSFLVLEPGDYLRAQADNTGGGATPDVDVFITYEEFFFSGGVL